MISGPSEHVNDPQHQLILTLDLHNYSNKNKNNLKSFRICYILEISESQKSKMLETTRAEQISEIRLIRS